MAGCYGCKDRHEGCHSVCETYRAYIAEKTKQNKKKEIYNACVSYDALQARRRREYVTRAH